MKIKFTLLLLTSFFIIDACGSSPAKKAYSAEIESSLPKDFFPSIEKEGVQFLVFGDSGTGGDMQMKVANSMKSVCESAGCDFGIILGDNFYEFGVSSSEDEQFINKFEKPYGPIGIKFYPSLGNHDHGYLARGGNTQAQVEYTKKSKYWRMPHQYYNFKVQGIEFIALDTNVLQNNDFEQLDWFSKVISESKAKWIIVYGHHPVFSYGSHGDNKKLGDKILPLLCQRADAYLAGHEHDLQLIQSKCGFPQLVSGSAGKLRGTSGGKNSLFHKSEHGFNRIEIKGDSLKILFYNKDGKEIYQKVFANR